MKYDFFIHVYIPFFFWWWRSQEEKNADKKKADSCSIAFANTGGASSSSTAKVEITKEQKDLNDTFDFIFKGKKKGKAAWEFFTSNMHVLLSNTYEAELM